MRRVVLAIAFTGVLALLLSSSAYAMSVFGGDSFQTFKWDTGSSQEIVQIQVWDWSYSGSMFATPALTDLPAGWAVTGGDPGIWASAEGTAQSTGEFTVWFQNADLTVPFSFDFLAVGPTTSPVTYTQWVTASWSGSAWSLVGSAASDPPGIVSPAILSVVDPVAPVPLPGTATLAVIGLGSLALRAIRRKTA